MLNYKPFLDFFLDGPLIVTVGFWILSIEKLDVVKLLKKAMGYLFESVYTYYIT